MHWVDWLVIAGYVGLIVAIAWRASRGQSSADQHLRASRTLPGWAVVFSVLATEVSAATYVGVPQNAFNGNWNYMQFAFGALLGKLALSHWFIRLYWRLDLPTAYGFLARRVGPITQRAAAIAFIGGRLIASGVRLYIAALPFAVVTGLSLELSIVLMAAVSTAYTFLGGLRAVVWTDVAQGTVFALGAALALGVGLAQLDLPLGTLLGEAFEAGKLQLFTLEHVELGGVPSDRPFGWLASDRPFPVALLGGFALALATHGTDQEFVQHLLNTKTERASGRSLIGSGLATFPIVALFLSVGTMLWLFHRHVDVTGYSTEDSKRIFPNFILHELPVGARGLVFAGLFAAALSNMGAMLNAGAAAWIHDVRPRASSGATTLLRVRFLTFVLGAALLLIALYFANYESTTKIDLIELALSAMTILYGGILGAFLAALLWSRRGSDRSVTAGMCVGILIGAVIFFQRQLFDIEVAVVAWPWSIPASATATLLVAATGNRKVPEHDRSHAAPMAIGSAEVSGSR